MEWFWILDGKRIVFDNVEAFYRKVFLTNPEELYTTNVLEIKMRLTGKFGNNDFSDWVAEEILISAIKAMDEDQVVADLSELCSVTLLEGYNDNELKVFRDNETFRYVFIHLPIFKIISETEDQVVLEYIPEWF